MTPEREIIAKPEWGLIRNKIIHPDDFDDRLIQDPNLGEQIAAVGTYSLSFLARGLSQKGLRVVGGTSFDDIVPVVHADLAVDIYKFLYPDDDQFNLDHFTIQEIVQVNRKMHGKNWGMRDTGLEVTQTDAFMKNYKFENLLLGLMDDSIDENDPLKFNLEQVISGFGQKPDIRNTYYLLLAIFKSEEKIAEYIRQARRRNGVQVIYGDKDNFIEFMKQSKHGYIDDYATEIKGDILEDLVMAVLPLGIHEQEVMGVAR